ncbi:MAG: hypothetical protein PHO92_03690, partial [Candidatus Peribacteraceae bacterium]|nr:hypothetical protein [Candidatus Peribacteraceae bacterium]
MLDNLMSLQPAASDPAPNGERRLIWEKNSRDDKKTHAGTTPELGGDAAAENPEAQQKPNAQKKRNEIEELTAERRKRILMHVPSTLLSKYTLGAFYLTDTLLSLLPERELRTVAEEVTGAAGTSGADLMKLENIETILASIFRKGESDVRIAKQLENMIRQKLSQYEELRAKAERLIAKKQDIPVDRIDQLEQELVLRGVTIDSWLRTASTEEVCDALGIPHMPTSQHGVLLTRIRTYLETRRLLENWNMPAIDRNAQLRKMLAEGRSISGIQQELYEETREVLPVLAEIIREQMREEAAKTRRWLDGERKKYEKDVPNVTLQNHEEVEDATDALFLQRHGVSAHALAREIEQSEAAIALAEGTGNDASVEKIVDAATLCERLHDMREFPGSGQGRAIVAGPANEQRAAEAWAEEMRGELDTLLREQYPTENERKPVEQVFGVEDLFGELSRIRGDLTPSDANPRGVNGYYYPARRRQNLLVLVRSLREHRIVKAVQAQRELATQAPKANEDLTVMEMVEQTRQKLDTTVGDLVALPALNRGIAETIGVPRHVRQRQLTLDNTLRTVTQPGKQAHATVADVQVEVEKLSTAARMLKNLEKEQAVLLSSEEFVKRTGADMYAAYDYATAEILINEERCRREGRDIAKEIEHEKEHAVQDILTRRSGVFPFLHRAAYEVLSEENEQFTGQLIEQAKTWGLAGQLEQIRKSTKSEQEAQEIFQELLTEELLNRYVDWKQGRLQEPTTQERQLFSAIEHARLLEHMQGRELVARNERTRADIQPIRLFQSGTATEEEVQTASAEEATGGFSANVRTEADDPNGAETQGPPMNIRAKLEGCRAVMQKIREFAAVYPAYQGDLKEELPLYQESYDTLLKVFETQMLDGKPYPHPEENPNFKKQVADLSSELEGIYKQIQNISNKMHDLSEEQPTGLTGYRAFFKGIYFLSPLDIYLMFQDAMEDVKRMWQRRSKQSRAAAA